MSVMTTAAAVAILIAIACGGCTDKDREMAKRTSDGTDTFKFKAPEKGIPPAATENHATQLPKSDVKPVSPKTSDGSDTFHFKPDPKLFPNASAQRKN